MALTGCTKDAHADVPNTDVKKQPYETQKENIDVPDKTDTKKTDPKDGYKTADNLEKPTFPSLSADLYDGNLASIAVNDNQPYFTETEKCSTNIKEEYSPLDSLGRCGPAFTTICRDIMPDEERGEIGSVKPSGWHTAKYPNLIQGNYLYNRCHLIGYQLAGENANEMNLITGTRYLNVTGMLPYEDQVAGYVKDTGNTVLYRVTPVYEGDDLVAQGVLMEAWSIEDKGRGVCFNVFCFNVQPGIEINYATGESKEIEDYTGPVPEDPFVKKDYKADDEVLEESAKDFQNENEGIKYVLNTNSRKIHLPSCEAARKISEHSELPTA